MVKYEKMMMIDDCDFILPVGNFTAIGNKWYNWFLGNDKVRNRTGDWFFGVVALQDPNSLKHENCSGLTKSNLLPDFGITRYDLRIFTGGCYYFNSSSEEWEGIGVMVNEIHLQNLGWFIKKSLWILKFSKLSKYDQY